MDAALIRTDQLLDPRVAQALVFLGDSLCERNSHGELWVGKACDPIKEFGAVSR